MQTVRCVCGEEILVLPSAKAMDHAIEKHARKQIPEHNLLGNDAIADDLAIQVIEARTIDPAFDPALDAKKET